MCDYPPFQYGKSRFNQETFRGRFRHFLDVIDPSTLFVSQAIIRPDAGEKILMPFRMSGFVPFGTPVVIGLLLPNQTIASTVFWQPAPLSKFSQGYVGAVTSAVSIAETASIGDKDLKLSQLLVLLGVFRLMASGLTTTVGLNVLIQKADRLSPTTKLLVQRFVPFPAVGTFRACPGQRGLSHHGASSHRHGRKLPLLQRRLVLPVHSLVCLAAYGLVLPLAISLFPQMSQISANQLEPEIVAATDCQILTYNKGL